MSGDHKECVLKCLRELFAAEPEEGETIISGDELRQRMENMFVEKYEDGKTIYKFADGQKRDEFIQIAQKIQGVYRISSREKFMFISGLSFVSVAGITGESNSDALAIGAASVGFAMGQSGCEVAKAAADIVMLDDNFVSIFNAVRWGRNVFDNVRKFIQFQLTVNFSCLWIVILGGASLGMSPFTILQLLWINLVMDILAAIALSSEAPIEGELRQERINLETDALVSPFMWRSIYTQLVY